MNDSPIRVLLVDDDEDDYIITLDLLSESEGGQFDLEWVGTYEAALETIGRNKHDVCLLDYHLGKRNGLELLREAVANGCKAPLILLTGQGDREVDLKAMRAGAADYLIKGQISTSLLERSIRYAIERAQTLQALRESEDRLRRRATELEAVAQVSSALREAQTVEQMLPIILQEATQVLGATLGTIFLTESETNDLVSRACYPPDFHPLGLRHPPGEGITGHVAATGETYITENLSHDPLAHILPEEAESMRPVCAFMSLPLRTRERIIGTMNIGSYEPHTFTDNEVRLATAIADIAANALHRAEVMETLEYRVIARTRELEEANARLQELDRLKSKFVSDVSHELRTPTANIKLFLHLLENSTPEKQTRCMFVLNEQTNRLVDLIEDILNLSRLDMDKTKSEFAPVDLNVLVERIVIAHQLRAENAGLQLTFEPCAALPPVRAESNQLSQVVTNLVTNAVNYTPAGQVRVSTHLSVEQKSVCVQVQDTGMGIAAEDLPHLFERFYRGQSVGSSNIPGSGLGLAIVKEVVDLHGGKVEVESEVGKGSTFRVWLPLEEGTT